MKHWPAARWVSCKLREALGSAGKNLRLTSTSAGKLQLGKSVNHNYDDSVTSLRGRKKRHFKPEWRMSDAVSYYVII
jgi:hypothetical protein